MADVIQGMLQQALGDAARASKFEAYINFNGPVGPQNSEIYMQVKTSVFPGKSHEPIDLKYKGRSIPIRGQVKYDNTWSCTFYLTEGHELKLAFEDWIESLDQTQNMSANLSSPVKAGQIGSKYSSELAIAQMDFTGENHTSVYTLHNCFPKSVSAVQVDYSSTGQILEFTVEFSYTHFTSVQVGGVKMPAKGSGQAGYSVLASNTSNNFTIGNGQNFGDAIEAAANKAKNDLANSMLESAFSGDFSNFDNDVRNIATNFGGAASGAVLGAVVGTFDSAKSSALSSMGVVGRLEPVNRAFDNAFNRVSGAVTGAVSNIASNIIRKF